MEQLLNEDVKQTLLVKVEAPEETSHGGVMEVPESTCKKEEMEEVMIGQEENHLCVKEESSAASFAVSTTSISNVTQMLLVKVEPPEQASVALEISESSYKKEEVMEDCVKEESSASSFPVSTTSINNVTQMLHVKVEAPEEKSHGVVLDVPESPYKKEEVIEAVIGQEEKQLCVKESSAASFPNSPASINNVMPVKVEVPSHGVVLDVPESSYKKEEPEEILIGQEKNLHTVNEESSAPSFPVSTTSTNSKNDSQTPLSGCPTNGSNQQITGGAGSTGNPNLNAGVDISNSLKTKVDAMKAPSKANRRCAFGCNTNMTLFTIPKEQPIRQKWMEFIPGVSELPNLSMFVCDRHFTGDCFSNFGMCQSGLSERLALKSGSIPTIKKPRRAARGGSSQDSSSRTELIIPLARSVGVQTTPIAVPTRTVSTQLSLGTLKQHFVRSKGVQAPCLGCDKSTDTRDLVDASTGPSKRPRLEEEEEPEDDVEDEDISDGFLPQDPTYEPADSAITTSTTAASVAEVEYEVV